MTGDHSSSILSPSDLFLAPDLSDESVRRYLNSIGFRDPAAADRNLQLMADDYFVRQTLGAMAESLMDSLRRAPDPDSALVGFERYLSTRTAKINFLNYLAEDILALDLLVQVLGTSPFLSEILIRNPEYFHWLRHEYDRAPFDAAHYKEEISPLLETLQGAAAKLDALKRFKRRHISRIAARDILGAETLPSVTAQLSDLADTIVEKTCRVLWNQQAGKERSTSLAARKSRQKTRPRQHFCAVGMGKLGGRELNYSSDIDLIYVFDADAGMQPVASRRGRKSRCATGDDEEFFLKLARDLTRALTEYTSESYLYRVDLRLRPMGTTGQIAYSIGQYRHYYETWGETFERFALIKARPIAGDLRLGSDFLEMIRRFVYRKYMDHAALEEIVRIKARADAASGDEELEQNVKTGRGGIREIELFTQILQLLYGGSQPELQNPNTLEALNKLLHTRFISESVCEDLVQAYIFLRTVEHRLQIVQERQVHTLPTEKTEREICARRLGFASASELDAKLNFHRGRVRDIYERLLHDKARGAGGPSRRFVAMLAGEIPEAEAPQVLGAYAFKDPAAIVTAIQSLDNVPSLAHSHSATRNLLANLLPSLLEEAAACAEPEKVLNRLEQLASKTGAGSSLFLSLLENELLRHELIRVLDSGELLAQRLIRYPELLDSLLITVQSSEAPRRGGRIGRKSRSRSAPGPSGAPEPSRSAASDQLKHRDDRINELRRFKSVEEFKILVSWLRKGSSLEECQKQFSCLAQFCVTCVAEWHAATVAPASRAGAQWGRAGADWAIFGLGKLGSGELTVHSDLDLVFFYRGDPADSVTFMKHQNFVQAVQHALEEPTSHGVTYKIDTRLRPEGNKGAPAMPVATFKRYLQTRAGKWERLAWTRSRFLAGSKRLAAEISREANSFVYASWDSGLPKYMDNVRSRMEAELSQEAGGEQFDFKVGYGALADIDFLLQMIQIREGERNQAFRLQGARRLLAALQQAKLGTRLISKQDINTLLHSYSFLRHLEILARMESDSNINWIPTNPALLNALGRRMGMPGPEGRNLLRHYRETTKQIRAIYRKTLRRLRK